MGVGVRYTGVDGRITDFVSDSVDDAFGRLSKISGYLANRSDEIAAGLAGGWRERHKARTRENISRLGGVMSGGSSMDIHSGARGMTIGEQTIGDLTVSGGKLVSKGRKRYLSADGNVIGYGPRVERNIADVDFSKENAKIDILNADMKDTKRKVDEFGKKIDGTVQEVVTGVDFALGNNGLEVSVTKAKARVIGVSDSSTTKQNFGEKISVHAGEGAAEVIVLGSGKQTSAQAKIKASLD